MLWVLNYVLQCLKMVKDGRKMYHAVLDLINLLYLTALNKAILKRMIFLQSVNI